MEDGEVVRGGTTGSHVPDCSMQIFIPNITHTSLENGGTDGLIVQVQVLLAVKVF